MKKIFIVWNQTNYGDGYEFLGAYTSKTKAQKAYSAEMKERYGTANFDKLLDLWCDGDSGCEDSWKITEIEMVEN